MFTLATKGVETMAPQNDRSSYDLRLWPLPLFKAVGLVPKTSQAAARSDIACASEFCSYHLGRESLDLLPRFKDMYIGDVCNCTYQWQCLLKTDGYNAMSERLFTPMTHEPAQPVLT